MVLAVCVHDFIVPGLYIIGMSQAVRDCKVPVLYAILITLALCVHEFIEPALFIIFMSLVVYMPDLILPALYKID